MCRITTEAWIFTGWFHSNSESENVREVPKGRGPHEPSASSSRMPSGVPQPAQKFQPGRAQ